MISGSDGVPSAAPRLVMLIIMMAGKSVPADIVLIVVFKSQWQKIMSKTIKQSQRNLLNGLKLVLDSRRLCVSIHLLQPAAPRRQCLWAAVIPSKCLEIRE